jgi:hypothetical protein
VEKRDVRIIEVSIMLTKDRKVKEYLKEILQKPEFAEIKFRYRDILFFAKFVRPVWKLGAISLVLTVITTGLGSLLPLISKILIDFIIMKTGFQRVGHLLKSFNLESFIPNTRYFLRAFLKNPPTLIFDEPTSALDADLEALLKDSIKKLAINRTTFIIALRLSTIDIAHKILFLDNGKIVQPII